MSHWAIQYLGQPWRVDRDCWGFFREVQATHFGRQVPAVDVDSFDLRDVVRAFTASEERDHWLGADQPRDGDAVLMGRNQFPSHIGIWLDTDGGRVLHCQRKTGVVAQPLATILLGAFPNVTFWTRS